MLQTFKTVLSERKELTPKILQLKFDLIEPSTFAFEAGQYMIIQVGEKRRHYSLCSSQNITDSFELLVELLPNGVASTYLNALEVGKDTEFHGPAGMFSLKKNDRDKILLATGSGIAPIRSILLSHLAHYPDANFTLFWGLKTMSDVYFTEELEALAEAYKNFRFFICVSREDDDRVFEKSYFVKGRVNSLFESRFPITDDERLNQHDYYICGNYLIVESLRQYLLGAGISKENILFEKFV